MATNNSNADEQSEQKRDPDLQYSFGLDGYSYHFPQEQPATAVPPAPIASPAPPAVPVPQPQAGPRAADDYVLYEDTNSRPLEYIETHSHGRRPIQFTPTFKFKSTLLNIFWKVDTDGDRRLIKDELYGAMVAGRYHGDEELLVALLVRFFDNIRRSKTRKTYFDARGITWDETFSYEGWARYISQESLQSDSTQGVKPHSITFQKKR